MENVKITIFTRVYNTKEYLRQCVSSVLTQSFSDFEYVIVDNGSTDGSSDLLEDFAAADKRIRLIQKKENRIGPWALEMTIDLAKGQYFTVLDSDDWWEPGYLERLVTLLEENNLDIACAGTVMHQMSDGSQILRKVDQTLLLQKFQFADALPWYHAFCRTTWGKLIRMECIKKVGIRDFPKLSYGGDTWWCFQLLRHAASIGIDSSLLHHYRIHKKSVSYKYSSDRFDSDVFLYNDAVDFLSAYGPVSAQNRMFLQRVYSNAVTDTFNVIHGASLTAAEKLCEYRRIATHPLTVTTYRECTAEEAVDSRALLFAVALQEGAELKGKEDDTDLRVVLQTLLPNCGKAVTAQNLSLFLQDKPLLEALGQDDAARMAGIVMEWIAQKRYVKQYDLGLLLCGLLPAGSPLRGVADTRFYMKYAPACGLILRGERLAALDWMTSLLLEDKKLYDGERFLEVYLTLAALEEQTPAFLFGKLRLARLLLEQGQREKSRAVANELTEMGLENEDMDALLRDLEAGV